MKKAEIQKLEKRAQRAAEKAKRQAANPKKPNEAAALRKALRGAAPGTLKVESKDLIPVVKGKKDADDVYPDNIDYRGGNYDALR